MFEQCQTAKKHVGYFLRIFRFYLATIFLAFAFVFSGAVGSMGQHADPYPDFPYLYENGANAQYYQYSSNAPFGFLIWFDDEVEGFGLEDITVEHSGASLDCLPIHSNLREEIRRFPDTPEFRAVFPDQAGKVIAHYFGFEITPRGPFDIILTVGGAGTRYNFVDTINDYHSSPPKWRHVIRYNGTGPFAIPVANAGKDRTVVSGTEVTLQGTGSTGDCSTFNTYEWTRTGGTGDSGVDLTGANSSRLSFTADAVAPGAADVTHVFELVATNGNGVQSVADSVTVTVESPRLPTVVNAGPNLVVQSGKKVTIVGNATLDPRNKIHLWRWVRVTGTGDPDVLPKHPLSGSHHVDARNLTFTADTLEVTDDDVTHTFAVHVWDDKYFRGLATDYVTVTVLAPRLPAFANAGPDQTVISGSTVTLDSRGSTTDPRISINFWGWTRTGGTGDPDVVGRPRHDGYPPYIPAGWGSHHGPTWTFTADTLDPGAGDVTHEFHLRVGDTRGLPRGSRYEVTDTVTVTVTPSAPPVADAGPDQAVPSGDTVTLDGTGSTVADSRRTIESYDWERTSGTGGSVTLSSTSAARPTFTADTLAPGAADVTHVFELTVTDNLGEINSDTVAVTVTAPFAAPVANAGPDRTYATGTTVTLDGSGSTVDRRRTISYGWKRTEGTGGSVVLSDASVAQPTFTAETLSLGDADVTHVFELTVTESEVREGVLTNLNSVTDVVTITVTAGNLPPDADAGPDRRVDSGATVELDGSASMDRDGEITSYAWARTGGTTGASVTLSGKNTAQPTFTAKPLVPGTGDVIHIFTLTVTDNDGGTGDDTVTVTVTPIVPLVAEAGPDQTVSSGATVTLDGSGSIVDPGRTIKSYVWERTDGTGGSVALSDANVSKPTFVADTLTPGAVDVTHVFTLTVTDSAGDVSTDTVTVTVTPRAPPVADAGPDQTVASRDTVTLDGTGSTVATGRTIKSYAWERAGGTGGSVILSDASVSKPTFTADTLTPGSADVTHDFTLTVTDNVGESHTDSVTVTVTAPIAAPVADAGDDQLVGSETLVTLDGTGSTVDRRRTIASYAWSRTSGTGASLSLSSSSAVQPTFTADYLAPGAVDVSHVFDLVVTDDAGDTDTDTVTVTVFAPFADPVADAGDDQQVGSGTTVTLNGSGSTVDWRRSIESYAWKRTGGTESTTVTLTGADTDRPSFTADSLNFDDAAVTHVFTLTVTDNFGGTSTDMVSVKVEPPGVIISPITDPFEAPVAEAGPNQTVPSGATVTLDGTASTTDRRRTVMSYAWQRTGGIGGSATLSDANVARPTFTADTLVAGSFDVTYIFELTVTDSDGESDTDTVTVTVEAPFAPTVLDPGDDQTVASGVTVTLDGSGSTLDRRRPISGWAWDRTGGTSADESVRAYLLNSQDNKTPTISFVAETLALGAASVTHELVLRVLYFDEALQQLVVSEDSDVVTVTIIPSAPPTAEAGDDQTVDSGAEVTLDGTGSTGNAGRTIRSWAWERTDGTGGAVTLSDASVAQPTFTDTLVPGAADVTHVFTLTVTDDGGETDTDTVTVTVIAPFAPTVANPGPDQTVLSGATVTLDAAGSTSDRRRPILGWQWVATGGTGRDKLLFGNVSAQTSVVVFTADTLAPDADSVTHEIILRVSYSDGIMNHIAESNVVTVTVLPNAPPEAEAGDDQRVVSAATVALDGSGSTAAPGRTIASYFWERTDGTTGGSVELSDANVADPTFTADTLASVDSDVTHVFELTVTDNLGETDTDTVTVTVTPIAPPPVADAGTNQTVVSEASVTLDGSGSSAASRRTIASYFWERTGGTDGGSVTLSDARVSRPTFTADLLVAEAQDVRHEFTLTVTDDVGESDTATVMVTVTSPFATPVAHAGEAQKVASGVTVTLDGRASTKDRRRTIASYLWKRTGGSGGAVELSSTSVVQPTFTADTLGSGASDVTHDFSLVVTDSAGVASVAATVTVTVTPNAPPEAHAGTNQTVVSEASVTLDGSGSTAATGRTIASYFWDRTGGTAGGSVTLSDARVSKPTFTADLLVAEAQDVRHEFTLTVTDDVGETDTATVMVTVTSPFATPVAHAGEAQKVASGVTVTLDGRASTKDRRRTIASYLWKRTGGSGGSVELSSTSVVQPTFTADTLGSGAADVTHDFSLVVTDSAGVASVAATVTVTVTPNAPPEAHAGTNQTVVSEASVTLDGSGSTAATGRTIASYFWDRTGGTENGTVTLSDARVSKPTFTADLLVAEAQDVRHEFTLTVTDDVGETDTATVMVTVTSPFATPVAHAGEAQKVASGATVMLDGRASTKDRRRTIASYLWKRTGGSGGSVELSSTSVVQPTFTADTLGSGASDVTHDFSLVVTDSAGVASVAATVTVTVTPNAPPDAHAAPTRRLPPKRRLRLTAAAQLLFPAERSRLMPGNGRAGLAHR